VPSSFNGWMYAEQIDNTTDVLPHVVLAHIRSLQSMVLLDACTIRSVVVLPLNFVPDYSTRMRLCIAT
jgi:hypothetical protein